MTPQGLSFNSSLSLWERVRACPCEGRGVRAFIPSIQCCWTTSPANDISLIIVQGAELVGKSVVFSHGRHFQTVSEFR